MRWYSGSSFDSPLQQRLMVWRLISAPNCLGWLQRRQVIQNFAVMIWASKLGMVMLFGNMLASTGACFHGFSALLLTSATTVFSRICRVTCIAQDEVELRQHVARGVSMPAFAGFIVIADMNDFFAAMMHRVCLR